jgi:hypothetical protein
MASRQLLVRLAVGVLVAVLACGVVEAAGPWKGQIVDRDTDQPIAGAVVVAIWTLRSPGVIHPEEDFHSALEVVSDEEGRFVIPEHTAVTTKPLAVVEGPDVRIFKSGYGRWQFQGSPYYAVAEDLHTAKKRIAAGWERFVGEGVVIELPRITDRRKRTEVHIYVRPGGVPAEHIRRLLAEIDADRIALGLPPLQTPTRER